MNSDRRSRRSWLAGAAGSVLAARAATLKLPNKVRLGIIGFDGHVSEILKPLPELPDVELVAVADAGSDPGAKRSALRNAAVTKAKFYEGYAEMLQRERLDCVAVCNNDGDRAAAVLAVLDKKLHVIAEKPLATTRKDFERIRSIAESQGRHVGMLLPMRFSGPYLAMKQVVDSGEIGEVAQIDGQKSYQLGQRPEWQRNARTYGSTILWIGPHMIDLMLWASGRSFRQVASFQSRVSFPEMRDMQNATASVFLLDNGGTATLRMDYFRPAGSKSHGDDRLRLAGTKGIVEYQERTGVTVASAKGDRTIDTLPPGSSVFLDYLRCVYLGEKPALSWKEIVAVNNATLAAHEAAETGRILTL
jgi:predicted dehydrogenase